MAVSSNDTRWTVADARLERVAVAVLGIGVVGGSVTAGLTVLFGASDVTPVARVLAIALPLILLAMIGWRLAGHAAAPGDRLLGGSAAAGVLLLAAAQAWPLIGETVEPSAAPAVLLYGSAFGLIAAAAALVVVLPALLLLRLGRVRAGLASVQAALTVLAMAVTAGFAFWVTFALGGQLATGMAAVLAGVGAILATRWVSGVRSTGELG